MPRKYTDYSKTYVYRLTCKNPAISDAYISYTTNLTQRKYKHKRETLDLSIQSKLYECIRMNGGWTNWKCDILAECACTNEIQAREHANLYIFKMKPNLNDEKMDEKCLNTLFGISEFKPNIFGGEMAVTVAAPVFEAEIFGGAAHETISVAAPTTKDGKYICLCKKSYSHRSSYYKHTSTCLQFQHNQSVHKHPQDSVVNTVSVSIISTTTTTTTTTQTSRMTSRLSDVAEEPEIKHATEVVASSDDENNRMVRYRFKSRKKVDDGIFHYSVFPEPGLGAGTAPGPEPELTVEILETTDVNYSDKESDSNSDAASSTSSSSTSSSTLFHHEQDAASDASSSVVSELLTEQNEKLKDYIRKMISALTAGKKRNKKSLVNSLVFELLDQNKTLQKQIIELSKERNIIVNNTNNNQFNLNFFLNEQCKDAVNLSDFVNSLEITMDDLTYTRNQGLVEGISKVMIDGLKQLDLYKRPIHCTDQKRDTIYVRDNHQWARDEGNARMRQAFVDIANKEYFAIKKWMDLHPGWETNSRLQDFHHKMVKNVLHEIKDDPIGERKIMKSVEREVFIEK
jgi:hypothetical protein